MGNRCIKLLFQQSFTREPVKIGNLQPQPQQQSQTVRPKDNKVKEKEHRQSQMQEAVKEQEHKESTQTMHSVTSRHKLSLDENYQIFLLSRDYLDQQQQQQQSQTVGQEENNVKQKEDEQQLQKQEAIKDKERQFWGEERKVLAKTLDWITTHKFSHSEHYAVFLFSRDKESPISLSRTGYGCVTCSGNNGCWMINQQMKGQTPGWFDNQVTRLCKVGDVIEYLSVELDYRIRYIDLRDGDKYDKIVYRDEDRQFNAYNQGFYGIHYDEKDLDVDGRALETESKEIYPPAPMTMSFPVHPLKPVQNYV